MPPEARFIFQSPSPQSPAVVLSLKNLVGWPDFTVQSVVKSEFVDATDAQVSLLRIRPRG